MKEELVSVIIPIYNASKYLEGTIECIINQSYQNLEIILINDGSTDSSLDICNAYKEKDSRIVVIDKDNSGQSDSRNVGIAACHGTYIYFADSDDEMDPQLIRTCVEGIEGKNTDLYIFNYYKTYIKSNKRRDIEERAFAKGLYDLGDDKKRFKFYTNILLNYGCGFEVWNRLYKAEIIKSNNIRFPKYKPVIAEDLCFNLFYMMYAQNVEVTNNRLYHYLIRDDSSMGADRGLVRINQYNMVSRIFNQYVKDCSNKYFERNYDMIHVLLLYHELMNMELLDMKKELDKVDDRSFLLGQLGKSRFKLLDYIKIMGLLRGVKYNLLSGYYYKGSRVRYIILKKLMK